MTETESTPTNPAEDDSLRLHIGGREAKQGWKILNIQDGPGVDFVGNCVDLSQFPDGSVAEIYASHVVEHLGYQQDLPKALAEFHRVLRPGGRALISVPDLELLCRMFIHPELKPEQRFYLMRVIMGGQCDDHDFHKVGLSLEILSNYMGRAGFRRYQRVKEFGIFQDASSLKVFGQLISLNAIFLKDDEASG